MHVVRYQLQRKVKTALGLLGFPTIYLHEWALKIGILHIMKFYCSTQPTLTSIFIIELTSLNRKFWLTNCTRNGNKFRI